ACNSKDADPLPTNNQGYSLNVKAVDPFLNPVEDAYVSLYETESDYVNETRAVNGIQRTDASGTVTLYSLKPISYFIKVEKGSSSNYYGNSSTQQLKPGMNFITI